MSVEDNFLSDCSCFRVNRLSRRVTRYYDRALSSVGLNMGQFALLSILGQNGSISLKELGAKTDSDPTTLTRNLKNLSDRDLVTMGWSEVDRRARMVKITEQGTALCELAFPVWKNTQLATSKILGTAKVRALHTAIDNAMAQLNL